MSETRTHLEAYLASLYRERSARAWARAMAKREVAVNKQGRAVVLCEAIGGPLDGQQFTVDPPCPVRVAIRREDGRNVEYFAPDLADRLPRNGAMPYRPA